VGWRVDSGYTKLDVGTTLTFRSSVYVAGHEPAPLQVGDQILVTLGVNDPVMATIVEATEVMLSLQMPDGITWNATPRTDPPVPSFGGAGLKPSEDWVVRERGTP
jgi:hypothetical protein